MRPKTAFWKWSLLGGLTAAILIVAQASAVGGYGGLLQVGEDSAVRPLIESELGDIPLAPHSGHDGQISYAIGLDLLGEEVPELLDHGAYRYRRVLYPALASLFGVFDGQALLVGMIVVTVVSTGAASGVTAAIASRFDTSDWWALVTILNPGVWLSVRLLTSDMLAIALMQLGLYWVVTGRRVAVLAFTLSGLSKDSYLTTPGGLSVSRDRSRWRLILIPVAVLSAWIVWLTVTMGEGFSSRGNLTWPFVGFVDASPVWATFSTGELIYLVFALSSVAVGLLYSLMVKSWLRWPILAWSVLGITSSDWVWDFGNNAARVFAPIVILLGLAESGRRSAGQDLTETAVKWPAAGTPSGEPR